MWTPKAAFPGGWCWILQWLGRDELNIFHFIQLLILVTYGVSTDGLRFDSETLRHRQQAPVESPEESSGESLPFAQTLFGLRKRFLFSH